MTPPDPTPASVEQAKVWPCRFDGPQYGICMTHHRDFRSCFADIGTLRAMVIENDAARRESARETWEAAWHLLTTFVEICGRGTFIEQVAQEYKARAAAIGEQG